MQAEDVVPVVDLLLTVGYIDGRLQDAEQAFIRSYIDQLVAHFAPEDAKELRAKADEAYARLEREIAALADEVVATGDEKFTRTRLKTRAVELFHNFAKADQRIALELLDAVVHTDGTVTDEERELHDELRRYFEADATLINVPIPPIPPPADLWHLELVSPRPLTTFSHPLLDVLERPFAADTFSSDYGLIFQAINAWEKQRSLGDERLMGVTDIGQLAPGSRFLDGHIHVLRPNHPTELIVLGDLHGCYACLKAALMQSDFIERARRHQQDPTQPDVKLVLLGDYLDRGRFGFEGVLRTALQLFVALPEHVILLRGNHEYLLRVNGTVMSAVHPAEAVPGIAGFTPSEILEAYRHLFTHMPTGFLFERTLFVHGGIPREDTLAARFHDLSSLDDDVLRFEMMWGDPIDADRIAVELQRESPRFGFGRDQFRSFMDRAGLHTLIRGHEAVDPGFITNFDLGHCRLHTLFSAGGSDNTDLPTSSRYRSVTPTALTVANGKITPWPIDYRPFNDPARNGHYR